MRKLYEKYILFYYYKIVGRIIYYFYDILNKNRHIYDDKHWELLNKYRKEEIIVHNVVIIK